MTSAFWAQIGVMALTFGLALLPALASRRMERSDYLTLMLIPPAMFVIAVLPGIVKWGFTKDSATYLLGMGVVMTVATINYRFPPKAAHAARAAAGGPGRDGEPAAAGLQPRHEGGIGHDRP